MLENPEHFAQEYYWSASNSVNAVNVSGNNFDKGDKLFSYSTLGAPTIMCALNNSEEENSKPGLTRHIH